MKQATLIGIFTLLALSATAQPHMTWGEKEHNFGSFDEEAGPVTHRFKFVNDGNEPLVLNQVRSTCGCTVPEYTRQPIAPGDSGVVKVTYDPAGRPGRFNKPIYVVSNASETQETLHIKGNVIPSANRRVPNPYRIGDLSLSSLHIPLFDTPKGKIKEGTLMVRNEGVGYPIPEFRRVPPHITVEIIPPVLHPDEEGILKITYDPDAIDDWGFHRDEFDLVFEGQQSADFNTITVSANLLDNFSALSAEQRQAAPEINLSADVVDFGIVKGLQKQKQTIEIVNQGKSTLVIHKVANDSRVVRPKLAKSKIKPGKSTRLIIEADPSVSRDNLLNTRLMIITNDPRHPSLPLRVLGSFE